MSDDEVRGSLLGSEGRRDEADDVLAQAEFGVLGLTNGSEAYTVPLSFGYDDGLTTLYFLLAFDEGSRKREFIATTDVASFLVVDSELPDDWRSVRFAGTLGPVPEGEREAAYAALAETAEFPAVYTFEEYVEASTVEQVLYALDVDSVSTRRASSP